MRTSMLRSLIGIVLILIVSVTCSREREVARVGPASTVTVNVALLFNGVAHLIGTATNQRLLIVPTHTAGTTSSPAHIPVILASHPLYDPSLSKTDTIDGPGNRVFRWDTLPIGFDIDLAGSTGYDTGLPGNTPVSVFEPGSSTDMCPNVGASPIPARSLHWLPRLSEVSRRSGSAAPTIDAKYTMARPNKDDVAVRFDINRGSLRAEDVSDRAFVFTDGTTTVATQAVANFLRYDFQVVLPAANPRFELKGKMFADGSTTSLGTFKASARNEIEIIIANLPRDGFFRTRLHGPLEHFHDLNYRVITGLLPTRPTPSTALRCSGGGVSSEVECGPDRLP